MPQLIPSRGGGVRLTPNGDGTYASTPITPPDPLEGAHNEERKFFIEQYGPLTMLEMCQRLRIAEWNAAQRERQIKQQKETLRQTEQRLTKAMARIQASPPDGYTMPTAAAQLVERAEASGWTTAVRWTPPDYDGEPHVKVAVAQGGWRYEVTWHSRGCQPGRVRLFSSLAWTPERPAAHDAPSIKGICAVINANPATRGAAA